MNPSDYYRLKSAEIKEADVRLVAACMSEHIGEQNAVRIEALAARVDMGERQVRDILEALVTEHSWLIGAHAGRAGRWIIATDEEKWHVAFQSTPPRGRRQLCRLALPTAVGRFNPRLHTGDNIIICL